MIGVADTWVQACVAERLRPAIGATENEPLELPCWEFPTN